MTENTDPGTRARAIAEADALRTPRSAAR